MTDESFDYSMYTVSVAAPRERGTTSSRRARSAKMFIAGRLPWEVAIAASHLPGATVRLCLVLQLLRKLDGKQTVLLRRQYVAELAIEPKAETRALAQLEKAGLVSVERRRGRRPRVTVHWDDDGLRERAA